MKQALITGASEGIGRAMVKKWISQGYFVTGVARNETRLTELKAEFADKFDYIVADLAKDVDVVAKRMKGTHFDIVINNAGFGLYAKFSEQPLDKLQQMIDLNISALVTLSHAYLKQAQPGDTLINVSSMLSFMPMPAGAVYAATKAFVTSFSESLWQQYHDSGVYVCALCPGATESEFFTRASQPNSTPPPKAIVQTAEQVAEIAWDASQDRSDPSVMCGAKNKIMALSTRVLSRKAVVSMMGRMR